MAMIDLTNFIKWTPPQEVTIVGDNFEDIWKQQNQKWFPKKAFGNFYLESGQYESNQFSVWENESIEWIHNAFDLVTDSWPEY